MFLIANNQNSTNLIKRNQSKYLEIEIEDYLIKALKTK